MESMERETPASRLAALIEVDPRPEHERELKKLRLTLALYHDGVNIKRQNIRREHPTENEEQIEERVLEWLLDRPHEQPGERVPWPRIR